MKTPKFLQKIIDDYKSEAKERKKVATQNISHEIFQVVEYYGEFWITYNGQLFCPCSLFKTEPIETIARIRYEYMKRNNAV